MAESFPTSLQAASGRVRQLPAASRLSLRIKDSGQGLPAISGLTLDLPITRFSMAGDRLAAEGPAGGQGPSWRDVRLGEVPEVVPGIYGIDGAEEIEPGTGGHRTGVRAGTVHQLALSLLRRHSADHGRRPPQITSSRFGLVARLADDRAAASAIEAEIGWAKAQGLSPDAYAQAARQARRSPSLPLDEVADTYHRYQDELRRRGVIDLDDVLLGAHQLLGGDERFADAVRWRYRHLFVDELQDVNPAQFRLLMALVGDGRDLFVVGDPNQAIYGWNGADPRLLVQLPELVPGTSVFSLDENHRSSPQVVQVAAAVLGPDQSGHPRSTQADGPIPEVRCYDDESAEAEGVATILRQWSGRGRTWSDQAVLARTNDQLATVADALRRAGIPYRVAPGPEASEQEPGRNQPAPHAVSGNGDAVELVTFHRAKGLQWPSVCVIGLEDGLVPIVHAGTREARDEERRLLYVALTRASSDLCCTWAQNRSLAGGRAVEREPSPWLAAVNRTVASMTSGYNPVDAQAQIAKLRAGLQARSDGGRDTVPTT